MVVPGKADVATPLKLINTTIASDYACCKRTNGILIHLSHSYLNSTNKERPTIRIIYYQRGLL